MKVGESSSQAAVENRDGHGGVLRDLLKGLLFISLVLVLKLAVEHTRIGTQIHRGSYDLLQSQLVAERLPVVVVDISDLEPEKFDLDGQIGTATPREPLRKMIEAITEHQPKAIGIDIDFSPDESGYIHPLDPEFFQSCLDMREQRGVPIFLGIRRTMGLPPAKWLDDEKYQELAANILIPKDSRRMLSEIEVRSEQAPGVTAPPPTLGKSMSLVLADAHGREEDVSHGWFERLRKHAIGVLERIGFVEQMSERQLGQGLTVRDFLVDFSALESIESIRTINPVVLRDQSQRQRFQGKVVLLGSGINKALDAFIPPGRQEPFPGVLLHACAVYTLTEGPLYEVTGKGRIGIDILFLLIILLTITCIRFYYRNRTTEKVATHRLQGILTVLVVFVALVIGFVSVRATRVMWDDFSLALTALVFHPSIERYAERLWGTLRKHGPALFHRLIFKQNGKKPE